MYMMKTEIPFTRAGKNNKLKLHEAVGMMMDCCQFQEYQEKKFCEFNTDDTEFILGVGHQPSMKGSLVTAMRAADAPIGAGWKKRIDEDFRRRGKK